MYITESKVIVTKHVQIYAPSMSACFPKQELLKLDKLQNMIGISLGNSTSIDDWEMIQKKTDKLTVRNFFELTPKEEEVRNNYFTMSVYIYNCFIFQGFRSQSSGQFLWNSWGKS